jgi:hypothetical protein
MSTAAQGLTGAGNAVTIQFDVVGTGGTTTSLTLEQVTANETSVPAGMLTNGSIAVTRARIEGTVRYWNGDAPVPGTALALTGSTPRITATDADGAFAFADVPSAAWTLTPSKSDDVRMGAISSNDASLVLRSLVGMIELAPGAAAAADVNGANGISPLDASYILRLSVEEIGLPVAPSTRPWRFLPANRTYPTLTSDQLDQDFVAALAGDVSGNWAGEGQVQSAGAAVAAATAAATVTVEVDPVAAGVYDLRLTLEHGSKPIYSADLMLRYDPATLTVASATSPEREGQISIANTAQAGVLRMGLAGIEPLPQDALLARIRVQVRGAGSPLAALRSITVDADEQPAAVMPWIQTRFFIYLPSIGRE